VSVGFLLSRIGPIVIIVLVSMIINKVATIALTLTGVSRQSARFQARSALTGTGFTTSETEAMVNHPIRRRIVMWLMLVGNAGIISVVGLLFFTSTTTAVGATVTQRLQSLGLMVLAGAAVLWILGRPRVDRAMSRMIRRVLRRYTTLEVRDYEALLEISSGFQISEKHVRQDEWMAGRDLADLRLADEGVLVLGVQHPDGPYIGAPTGTIKILPGDVVTMYGPDDRLEDLDGRPVGAAGDRAHVDAIRDQATRERHEQQVADQRPEP
jgi:hypothetical protein